SDADAGETGDHGGNRTGPPCGAAGQPRGQPPKAGHAPRTERERQGVAGGAHRRHPPGGGGGAGGGGCRACAARSLGGDGVLRPRRALPRRTTKKPSRPSAKGARGEMGKPDPSVGRPRVSSRKRPAISCRTNSTAATARRCGNGGMPEPATIAAIAAPASPPTLKTPWKLDIIGRPWRSSMATACTFIETSSTPKHMPKTKRVSISSSIVGASDRNGSNTQTAVAAPRITRPLPQR